MILGEEYKGSEKIWGNLITCIWDLTLLSLYALKSRQFYKREYKIALLKSIIFYRVWIKRPDSMYADREDKTKLTALIDLFWVLTALRKKLTMHKVLEIQQCYQRIFIWMYLSKEIPRTDEFDLVTIEERVT